MSAKKLAQLMSIGFLFLPSLSLVGKTFPALSPKKQVKRIKKETINPMLKDLQPASIWYHFDQISRIPRASSHEQQVANYIIKITSDNGLQATQDKAGNVVVKKPASKADYQNSPTVVLQSHLDMVTEKNKGVEHDFSKDPIQFVRTGNYLGASGTTLGADNGIGVATMLSLMTATDVDHGPMEFLFTVEEESGFGGAQAVAPDTFSGRILLNLDSEEHGDIFVGCAGGCLILGEMPITYESPVSEHRFVQIAIDGLQGGHSGVDIHRGRAHALKILGQFFELLGQYEGRLASINGGNKHNAIPREAQAIVSVPALKYDDFIQAFNQLSATITSLYPQEVGMTIVLNQLTEPQPVIAQQHQDNLVTLINTIPQGVISMSPDLEGLVETSTHLARVSSDVSAGKVSILTSQRSLLASGKEAIVQKVIASIQNAGAQATVTAGYPGWTPNLDSPTLQAAQETFKKLFNQNVIPKAIHAGLECGEIGERVPGMDMISFGPTIINAHSPSEQVDVESVPLFWNFLTTLLQNLAEQPSSDRVVQHQEQRELSI